MYIVGGRQLQANPPLAALAAFAVPARGTPPAPHLFPFPGVGEVVHRGTGWLAGADRRVECRAGPAGYLVSLEARPRVWVAPDGSALRLFDAAGVPEPVVTEFTLGPGLAVALALQGTFCLHASAVAGPAGCVAFLGASGAGKSTLAALLAGLDGWRRAGDDILPVALAGNEVVAHPHFPQLKLAAPDQAALLADTPDTMSLVAVYVLDEPATGGAISIDAASDDANVTLRALGPREAVTTLLGHGVSTRLFAPELAARNLVFCADLASRVPVRILAYPHRRDVGPAVAAALREDLLANRTAT